MTRQQLPPTTDNRFVSPAIEEQFVGALLQAPDRIDHFTDLDKIVASPFARSAVKALLAHKTGSPVLIADAMSRNGQPGTTVEQVTARLVVPHQTYPLDIEMAYQWLIDLYLKRTGLPLFDELKKKAESGEIGIVEAAEELSARARDLSASESVEYIDYTDESHATLMSEDQRQLAKDGKLLTIPPQFPLLAERIKRIGKGIIVLLADTGMFKTSVVDIFAHHFAQQHGHTVHFCATEASVAEMRWRAVTRKCPDISYDDLEAGFWDDRCDRAIAPYPSGGRVMYAEAGGTPLGALISHARRNDADLIIDLFADILLEKYWRPGRTDSDVIKRALTDLDTFCQKTKRLAIVTVQTNAEGRKNARAGGGLDSSATRDSSTYEDKARLFLTISGRRAKKDDVILHPTEKDKDTGRYREIRVPHDKYYPVAYIKANKNRYGGGSGWPQLVWLDGARYNVFGIQSDDPARIAYYREYLK